MNDMTLVFVILLVIAILLRLDFVFYLVYLASARMPWLAGGPPATCPTSASSGSTPIMPSWARRCR